MNFNDMLTDVKYALLSPTKTAKNLSRRASLFEGVVVTVIISIISYIISNFFSVITYFVMGRAFEIMFVLLSALFLVIPTVIIILILTIIFNWITWLVGRWLGGKAEFGVFYGGLAYSTAALSLLSSLILGLFDVVRSVIVVSIGSVGGGIISLVSLLPLSIIFLLSLIYETIFTRELHRISTARAAVAVLVPLLLVLVVAILAIVLMVLILGLGIGKI